MNTNKKSIEIITLDSEIMDCFESNDELAVISGGKGIIEIIKELIPDINANCGCSVNNNC